MRVDTPAAALRARDQQGRPLATPGADFARAVTSRRPGDTPQQAATFAALVRIGDNAVRFDARPIVAPAAEDAETVTGADRLALTAVADAQPANLPNAQLKAIADSLRDTVTRVLATQPSAIGKPMTASPVRAATHAETGGVALASSRPIQPPHDDPGRVAPTRPSAASRPVAADRQPAVRVVAFADEVRVLIRGAALTDDDRAELARAARDTLADTPLAGRPVRLIETRGRG